MRIIGIDPGIEKTGFAVMEMEGNKIKLHDFGCIMTDKKLPLPARLNCLADDLASVLKQWKPAAAGIERVFFSRNVKTAITVSHARGVILEVLEEHGVAVQEFNPGHIKSAVTGTSKADKIQVRKMLHYMLGIQVKNDDTADAIACAICMLNSYKILAL